MSLESKSSNVLRWAGLMKYANRDKWFNSYHRAILKSLVLKIVLVKCFFYFSMLERIELQYYSQGYNYIFVKDSKNWIEAQR